ELYIDPVERLAGELVHGVEPLERLAGNRPVLRVLELDLSRRLDLGGGFRHLTVGRGAAGWLMRDHAVRRAALGGWHFPLIGGGLDQHFTGHRAAFAHIVLRLADAAASGAVVIAPYAVSGDVLTRRGIFGGDLRPVAFELLGDELGEPGERALTHLRAGDANDHRVVRTDHHPGVDLRRAVLRADHLRAAKRKVEAEHQP